MSKASKLTRDELQELNAWDRMPGESAKAFEAFTKYRDLGASRSLRTVGRLLAKTRQALDKWSVTFNWVERAKSWDSYLDKKGRIQQLESIKAMNDIHARAAAAIIGKVLERLQKMTIEELTTGDMIKWFAEAVKIERQARGEPGEIVKNEGGEKNDDEARKFATKIINDPVASSLACDLLEQLYSPKNSESDSGRIGETSGRGTVDIGETPGATESETD